MNINFSWKFHQKILTLTISFFVLNDSIEFVLIYRPHPVYELCGSPPRAERPICWACWPYLGEVDWSSGNNVKSSQLVQQSEALLRHLDLKIRIYSEQRRFLWLPQYTIQLSSWGGRLWVEKSGLNGICPPPPHATTYWLATCCSGTAAQIGLTKIPLTKSKTVRYEREISNAGRLKLDFAERDKCKPVLLILSWAGNLEKPLISLYGIEWRERGYGHQFQPPARNGITSLAAASVF